MVRDCYLFVCCCFFTITRWMSTVSMVQERALFSDVDDPIEDLYHLIREEVAGDSSFESLDEDDSPSTSTSSTKSSQVKSPLFI